MDKVKALTMLPNDVHVTARMIAEYYEVQLDNIQNNIVNRHRDEFVADGMVVLRGEELRRYKLDMRSTYLNQARSNVTLLPRRAVLRIGMLLTKSIHCNKKSHASRGSQHGMYEK